MRGINRVARVCCAAVFAATVAAASTVDAAGPDAALTAKIAELDRGLFEAYNSCDLERFASYFDPEVEFYHDEGGVTFGRDKVVANTRQYICHKVRRELIAGSLTAYPIKGYGAIEEGQHAFYEIGAKAPAGVARFVMVWKQDGQQWRLTRVLSYGHVPAPAVKSRP